MSKYFIALTNPCTESWENMTPDEKGRACMHCNKTVIDFTSASDKNIIRHFKKNKEEETCGRFREDQLHCWLTDSGMLKTNPALYRFLAGLFLLTASQNITAQARKPDSVETIKHPVDPGKQQVMMRDKQDINVSVQTNPVVSEHSKIRLGGARTLKSGKEPLLVVDGKIALLSSLSDMAPEDIKTETVLTGSNAIAIYGSKGANGVIIITTKSGEVEKKILLQKEKQECDDDHISL